MGRRGQYVCAYHLILTVYGFWLPNDPRGSWSTFVRSFELARFGAATKVEDPRSHARDPHDRARRLAAKDALARLPVRFDGLQARAIANGFARKVGRQGIVVRACAIMPDHAHLVIARHRSSIESIAGQLKASASRQLLEEQRHPFQHDRYQDGTRPTPWARRHWSVFLSDFEEITRAVRYVENNPIKDGLKPQSWKFITPYGSE